MSYNPETEMTTAEDVTSEVAAETAVPKTRKQLVQEMLSHWNASLEHTIAEETSSGYLELSAAHPGGLAQLYGGRPTRLSNLVREPRALPPGNAPRVNLRPRPRKCRQPLQRQ